MTAPTRAGRETQRFEVPPGDCGRNKGLADCRYDRERSEFSPRSVISYGSDTWIGLSVNLPKDFKTSAKVKTTLAEIHQKARPFRTADGMPSFPPLLQLGMRGDRYYAKVPKFGGQRANLQENVQTYPCARVAQMRGALSDVILHLKTGTNGDLLEVFVNDVRNARLENFVRFVPEYYCLKFGISRSFVSRHGGPMPTQILYFDDVKIAPTRAAVTVVTQNTVD